MNILFSKILKLSLLLYLSLAVLEPISTEAYLHNPLENPVVLRDTVREPRNVFGFAPAKRDAEHPKATLFAFTKGDYASFESVGKLRAIRIKYHEYVVKHLDLLLRENIPLKTKAKLSVLIRNQARLNSYLDANGKIIPGLEAGYKAAFYRAKHNTYDYFSKKRKLTDEQIILSAYGSNAGMDAVLGLYDRHFNAYKILVSPKVITELKPEEQIAYNKLAAHYSTLSLTDRDKFSYLYFLEPKTARKMIVHLTKWHIKETE